MPKKSSATKPWDSLLGFKGELMTRDPLGRQLTKCLLSLYLDNPTSEEVDELADERRHLETQLEDKYGVADIYVNDPTRWVPSWEANGHTREEIGEMGTMVWCPVGNQSPIQSKTNWCLPGEIRLVFDSEFSDPDSKAHDVPLEGKRRASIVTHRELPRPPDGEDPILTLKINLAWVTEWDTERLAHEFKARVRQARQALPEDLRRFPSALAFLRTVTKENFFQDLRRYDLHMTDGLTFRLIALLEQLEKRGETRNQAARSGPIGMTVRGESTVREAVLRIYRAIHRKPYRARRRRLDSPAAGVSEYHCAEHGPEECDAACGYLKEWLAKFNRSAPTDYTGCLKTSPPPEGTADHPEDPTDQADM